MHEPYDPVASQPFVHKEEPCDLVASQPLVPNPYDAVYDIVLAAGGWITTQEVCRISVLMHLSPSDAQLAIDQWLSFRIFETNWPGTAVRLA